MTVDRPGAVAVLSAWLAAAMVAPGDAQVFTSHAVAVRVDVLVSEDRKPVSGLRASDFELRDAGVVQQVRLLDVEPLPLNLILVFDTSQSVEGERMASLLDAARGVVAALREPDRVAVLSFATRVRLLAPLTPSRTEIATALEHVSASGATSLRDAIFAALALRHADTARMLLLVFSDGRDTSSWLSSAKVIEAAKRSDAVIYAVGVRQEQTVTDDAMSPLTHSAVFAARHETVDDIGAFLKKVVDETGGRHMLARTDAELQAAFVRTLEEFRNRYVLSYAPTGVSSSGWHPLDVKLKSRKGKVTARRGYFAEPASSPR